ncbi:FMRFamide receptor-like [Gigantopelta aegis]|uniref:FMRFamide receptor-like n=1 Tax=Gigantopelta aegis TaxID=1735272 RepID=UPI001B88B3A3|nr:FMRFamide receptor-like [Gigantopelta aegis]XP_041372209.1 FMRFamide receptor-like [Gigantopelta aegis]XP_041372211.1 FMRFamide receptor-like [Gigantopelta aegis]
MAMNFTNFSLVNCTQAEDTDNQAYSEFYHTARMVTGLILYPCICFPGLIGNFLTVIVMSQRNMRSSTNAFLSALAVSDAVKLINDILYFMVIIFYKTDSIMGNRAYGYLYPYAHFIFSLSVCVSSWLTVSVAVERYIMVCHPTKAREMCSRTRAVLTCISVYVLMTLVALPSAFRYRTHWCWDESLKSTMLEVDLTELWSNEAFVTAYTWAQNLLRSIIPLIVLVGLNACIIGALRKSRASRRNNSRHRVTIMMIMVIVVFMVCITPDAIMSTVFGFGYHEAGHLVKGIREFTDTLLALNAASNFIIYCLFNKVFRQSFTKWCCPEQKPAKFQTELDESQYRRLSGAKAKQSAIKNTNLCTAENNT